MNRRTFLAGAGSVGLLSMAGCLGEDDGRTVSDNPEFPPDDHENHIAELQSEMEHREVDVDEIELRDESVIVGYDSENFSDDLAEVSMAFVERIQGGWGVDRLEAVGRGEAAMSWHAETEWAEQYLDEEIDAEEYGDKINDTVEHMLLGGDGDDAPDGVDSDGD